MKNRKFNLANCFGFLIALVCVGSVLWLASCTKENDFTGDPDPKIIRVRSQDSSDVTVTSTLAGTWLVIQGENLRGTTHIYINNYDVPFNPAFNSETFIVFQLPNDVTTTANLEPGQAVNNKLEVVTSHGNASIDFNVALPPPTIYNITHELANAGSTISLLGVGFQGIEKIIFPSGVEVTEFTKTKKGTALGVVVPENPGIGAISITGIGLYGRTDSVFGVKGKILLDFDLFPSNSFSAAAVETDETKFSGNEGNGKYGYMVAAAVPQWSWNPLGNANIQTDAVEWVDPSLLGDSVANYDLKFEYYLKKPWIAGTFQIGNNEWGGDGYRFYFNQWYAAALPVTPNAEGHWQTITLPLYYFKNASGDPSVPGDPTKTATGVSAVTFSEFLNGSTDGKRQLFVKMFFNRLPMSYEAAVDNFRIVKTRNIK